MFEHQAGVRGTVWGDARTWFAIVLIVFIGQASAAIADEVTSKGTVLRGKVSALSSAGVTFAPEYGAGTLTIKWADIEDIKTDGPFQVLHGDDQEVDAPLQGFSGGKLQAGAQAIDVTTIASGVPIGAGGPSFND